MPRQGFSAARFAAFACRHFYEESAVKSKLTFPRFTPFARTTDADRQRSLFWISPLPLVAGVMPPKRTVTVRQDSPLLLTRARCFSLETTNCHASGLAASKSRGSRSHWPRPCARCLRQTSIRVGAHLCPRGTAGRSTTICIRPLAIRRSLVPGRPFCPAAASRQARLHFRPPGPVLDATLPSFPLFRLNALLLLCAKLCLPGEAESALQACNR